MGGSTFTTDGLFTPRMPQNVYMRVLRQLEGVLLPLFRTVGHAIETPGKLDHGDIDLLAVSNLGSVPSADEIAKAISAKKYFVADAVHGVMHFAISWPETATELNTGEDMDVIVSEVSRVEKASFQHGIRNGETNMQRYIQVDLTICSSESDFNWRLFAHGHGDLTNIVSSFICHKGLTITNQASYIHIPNLDTASKKLTRIELSKDPMKVLQFLGLDPEIFWKPFTSREAMLTYISTCRFYDPRRVIQETAEKRAELMEAAANPDGKKRHGIRPTFLYWYNEFVPAHKNDPPGSSAHLTRAEVREEAFAFFGGDIRQRYEAQEREVSIKLGQDKLWSDIRANIALENPTMTDKDIHSSVRAVRREIIPRESLTSTNAATTDVQKAYIEHDWAAVKDWAITNHSAALARWQELVRQSRKPVSIDERKLNKFSTSELETYTAEDDATIVQMKQGEQASWSDILLALGKTSKSQLQAHWKKNLQQE